MGYICDILGQYIVMKAKPKQKRVYRGINLPEEIDKAIREIAVRERRSVTRTVEILLESALKNIEAEAAEKTTS